MNWDAIGAIGELIGAAAVIGTLAYLAVQIKQQTAANNSSVHNNLLEGFSDIEAILGADEKLTTLFNDSLWQPQALTDAQASQFSWLFRLFINQYIKAFRLFQEGVISKDEWENYARTGAYLINTPGGELMLNGHTGVFRDFMQSMKDISTYETSMDITLGRKWQSEDRK